MFHVFTLLRLIAYLLNYQKAENSVSDLHEERVKSSKQYNLYHQLRRYDLRTCSKIPMKVLVAVGI